MRLSIAISIIAYLANAAVAAPTQDNAIYTRSADAEAIAEALSQSFELHSRALNIENGGNPDKDVICPKTERYKKTKTYTKGQIKAAYLLGASYDANREQIGPNNYPHLYKGNQKLPNECGTNTQEFVIMTDDTKYDGGPVKDQPDRVLYELKILKNDKGIRVKYCAVIRHVDDGFEQCVKIEKP